MQDEAKDCGAACLFILVKTYGGSVSMEYLRIITNTSKEGTNFYYLSTAAKTLGFDSRALKGDVSKLDKLTLPCIAHVIIDSKYKHFIVVHNVGRKYITIADPAYGIKKMTVEEFRKISTNQFLILIPNKKIPVIKNSNYILDAITDIIVNNKKIIIFIFCFSLIYTLINILTSYGFQFVIEDSINISNLNNLYFIFIFLILFTFIKHVIDYLRITLLNYINCKLDFILTNNTFKHIIFLPYQYYKTKSTADVLSRINDLGNIKETFSNMVMYLFVDSILVIFVFISLIRISMSLTFIAVLVLIIYILIIKVFTPYLHKNVLSIQEEISKVNLSLIESLEAVETVKGLNLEDIFCLMFSDRYKIYMNKNYKFLSLFNKENFIKELINGISISVIIFVGAILVIKDNMTIGELITYNTLIVYFLEPLKNIIDSDIYIKKAKVALRRINDLYSIKTETLKLEEKFTNKKIKGDIDIKDLYYSYNGRDNILSNINIKIKKGEKILLCGDSGSGKSTLTKILMKYYEIDNNIVKIDKKDLNDYSLIDIRRDICYVSQNEKILTDSIFNNIVINREVLYDDFLKICNLFQIENIIGNNICKYDMLLEENGFNISGGERQKIIMARALLKESSIYIFDESLSQVDIENERIILKNIFKYLKNKTIIFISHRFDNKDLFDKVLRLEEGHIK